MLKPALALFLFLSVFAPSLAEAGEQKCPVINGTYKRVVETKDKIIIQRIRHYTRQEGRVVSYTYDESGNFQRADGVAKPLRMGNRIGKGTILCEEGRVIFLAQEDGSEQINRVEMSVLNEWEIEVRYNLLPGRTGIYTKE